MMDSITYQFAMTNLRSFTVIQSQKVDSTLSFVLGWTVDQRSSTSLKQIEWGIIRISNIG